MLSESSTGRWAGLQLPSCQLQCKQGELSENILQNLFHNLTPRLYIVTYMSVVPDVDRISERRDVEPAEAALPAEEREGAAGQEPDREGRPHHREAELPALRHDHAPSHRRIHQEQAHQEGKKGYVCQLQVTNIKTDYL